MRLWPLCRFTLALVLAPGFARASTPAWADLDPNVRSVALGGAGAGLELGADSGVLNPAFLGWAEGAEGVLMHNAWLGDSSIEHAAFGASLARGLGGALVVDHASLGSVQGTVVGSGGGVYETEIFHPGGTRLAAALGKRWGPFGLGASLQGIWETGTGFNGSHLLWGTGLAWAPSRSPFSGGVYLQGEAEGAGSDPKTSLSVKPALSARWGTPDASAWVATMEGSFGGNDPKGTILGGVEWAYLSKYFVRVGYRQFMDQAELAGVRGLSAGAGWEVASLQIDYAFTSMGSLGMGHQLSISAHFAGKHRLKRPEKKPSNPARIVSSDPKTVQPVPGSTRVEPTPGSGMMDYYRVGQAALKAGRYKDSADAFLKAVAVNDPEVKGFYYAEAYSTLGRLYQHYAKSTDHLSKARIYYLKALDIDSQTESARNGLNSLDRGMPQTP